MFARRLTTAALQKNRSRLRSSKKNFSYQVFQWKKRDWSRLISFQTTGGQKLFGEPVIGADGSITHAKVIDENGVVTSKLVPVVTLLAPFEPAQIVCIGLNYQKHAAESKLPIPQFPVVFTKNLGALQHPGKAIVIPKVAREPQEVDYECELAVVIGKAAKNVPASKALDYVLGYTCANDVSARLWQTQRGGSQWCYAKSFDTFCPLGPVLVSTSVIPDPNALKIGTTLNGEVVQNSNTSDMIFSVPKIIEFLSSSTTLLPGTVILTGTPEGVGMARKPPKWLKSGDTVTIEIEKIGKLTNTVVDE